MRRATGNGRRRVVEALWRTVARDGMAGVSVRTVAAEAGVTGGTVQYYFPSRSQMVRHAMEVMAEQVERRIAAVPRSGPATEWTRAIILELLPLDGQRRLEFGVWLAFVAHADTDPELAELRHQTSSRLRRLFEGIVRVRREEHGIGEEGRAVDPAEDHDAALLHAVVDGVSLHLSEVDVEEAAMLGPVLVDHHLARVGLA